MLKKTINNFFFNFQPKKNFSCLFNEDLYLANKDFASKFKDNSYNKALYDINLLNTLNSLFLVKKDIENIVFVGPNPYLLLEKLPPSKKNKIFKKIKFILLFSQNFLK